MSNLKLGDSDFKQINDLNEANDVNDINKIDQKSQLSQNTLIINKSITEQILDFKLDFCPVSIREFIEESKDKLTKRIMILIIIYLSLFKDTSKIRKRKIKTTSKYYWDLILKNDFLRKVFIKKINAMNLIKMSKKILMIKNVNKLFKYILNTEELGEIIDKECNGLK